MVRLRVHAAAAGSIQGYRLAFVLHGWRRIPVSCYRERGPSGLGGTRARHEDFTSAGSTTVGIVSLNGALRYKLGSLAFDIDADGSSALADLEDFQLVATSGVTATIIAGFGFRISLLYEFDSTPQTGREKRDATLTTNLTYSFGK